MQQCGAWSLYRCDWQFLTTQTLRQADVPFFGAFGAAWDDGMVARWSAEPLGMLGAEREGPFAASSGGPPAAAQRPVVIIAEG